MTGKVIAIGLDAPDNHLLSELIDNGRLPNLAQLKRCSLSGTVVHRKGYSNLNSWSTFLTGIRPEHSKYWHSVFDTRLYASSNTSSHNNKDSRPFYAFDNKRVVMFDLPAAICDAVKGVQIIGWASDQNESYPESRPSDRIGDIQRRYGFDPKLDGALSFFNEAVGKQGYSYRVPSAYDTQGLTDFAAKLRTTVATRARICADLMKHEVWDLFITCFSELHVGGHSLWHLSRPHPLDRLADRFADDVLVGLYRELDAAIGALIEDAGPDVSILLFSVDSIVADCLETPRSVFLPELMFRWCFPGEAALAAGNVREAPPPVRVAGYERHWKHEVWSLREPGADAFLQSPTEQEARADTFHWQPTNWYKPTWHRMKAFALPSVADGYIRLNVRGREADGLVEVEDFEAVCDEIIAMLMAAVDARTGDRIVDRVLRTRSDPFALSDFDAPADLVVLFSERSASDTVDHPDLGRIGPIPYFRPGGHEKQGNVVANPFFIRVADPALRLRTDCGELEDLSATIAALLGEPLSPGRDGRSLLVRAER